MKNNKWVIGIIALIFALSIVGCSGGKSETAVAAPQEPTLSQILKNGKIVVASDFTAPPMQFLDPQGKATGMTVELINKAAEYLGVEVEWQDLAWESLIPSLQTGKVDMIAANMSITLERMKSIRFTDPVMVTGISVLVRKDSDVDSWADLAAPDKVMGATMGSVHAEYIRTNWNKETKQYEGSQDWINELKQGRIDGVMDDELLLAQIAKNNPELKLADGYVRPDTYGWAVKQGTQTDSLLEWFNWYIKWIKMTGEYNEIYEKYVGLPWSPNPIMD